MARKLVTVIAISEITIFLLALFFVYGNNRSYQPSDTIAIGKTFYYVYPDAGTEKSNCLKQLLSVDDVHYEYQLCDQFYNNSTNYQLVALDENYQQIDGSQVTLDGTEGTIILPKGETMAYIAILNTAAAPSNREHYILAVYQL